jgi:thiol-disulfide isomerase/thioredoxin
MPVGTRIAGVEGGGAVAVTREQFDSGLTYDQWKAKMTRNQERHDANERGLKLSTDDIKAFKSLKKPVNVVAIGEDWCGDVIANLPIVGKIAAESDGALNLKVFLRDENEELMNQFLKDGKYKSIPVVAFFDDDFNELGRWIERPSSVTDLREKKRQELYATHPEFGSPSEPPDKLPEADRIKLTQAITQMRDDTKPFADSEVVRELREIVEGIAKRG